MGHFNIGIDTGGTYTDAVIINADNHQVIATAKSLTTKGKLEIGVANALNEVMLDAGKTVLADNISMVSLSTTLATNALVEGMGSNVAAVLIGFSEDMIQRSQLRKAIPTAQLLVLDGGHEYDGSESCALDEDALRTQIEAVKDSVDAFAIAANYSVRNPAHELRARSVIAEHCNHPATISSELSDGLNGPLRALTATFNVRIVSLIINLVQSVRNAMHNFGIDAPLMIVKGDGSIASADSVIEKPIETILSGPAASVIGANFLSGLDDFIIADIGGTTSDVATVRNGWPYLNEKGAMAGGYRTMVRAIDMQTIGLGGDSEVELDHKGNVSLSNNRVVPIALLCHRFPHIIDQLNASLGDGMGLAKALRFIFLPEGFSKQILPSGLSAADKAFLEMVDHRPQLFDKIVVRASDRARAERFLDRGLIQVSGLTPSDAAHALKQQSQWSCEAARLGCLMLGRSHGRISWQKHQDEAAAEIDRFAQSIFDAMVGKSTMLMINQLAATQFSSTDPLVTAVSHGNGHLNDLGIQFKPSIPIVAVGGPAAVFYPSVGKRLNVDAVIPGNAEVANAIGAAIGRIKIRKSIEITSADSGGYHIHHQGQPLFESGQAEALEQATRLVTEYVESRAIEMGGGSTEVSIHIERIDLPDMDSERSLIAATITAECLSKPVF